MRHVYNVYVSGEGSYKVYHCDYCGHQTRDPEGHVCRKLDLRNMPPAEMLDRIFDNGNDAPAGRAGMPQTRHWTIPPYRASEDPYADTPEEEELREAAIHFSDSELTDSQAEVRLYEAATAYAATQAPYYEEGEKH